MSYSGADQVPECDVCGKAFVYTAIAPWPSRSTRTSRDPTRDEFLICEPCVQNLILEHTRGRACQLAHRSACRWVADQQVIEQAEKTLKACLKRIEAQRQRAWNKRHEADITRNGAEIAELEGILALPEAAEPEPRK